MPVLALDRLRARNRDGFSFTTDFELIKDGAGHPPEIDFAVIADGRLILGEAKKNDRLAGNRTEERAFLSKTCQTPAHAGDSQICAWLEATQVCSPSWSPGHVAELPIERSAAHPRDVHPGHAFEVFRGGRSLFK